MQPAEVRFTQRELREHLRWHDRALRRQLTRLVELEYVAVYRTGRGNQRVYQLLYRSRDVDGPLRLGLTDPEALRPRETLERRKLLILPSLLNRRPEGANRRFREVNRREPAPDAAAIRRPLKTA